jgi:type II secretory pathway pseudopilin PulG
MARPRYANRTPVGCGQSGFAYVAVLIVVAVFGAISASVVTAGRALTQRSAEEELLFVGAQFQNAIRSYHEFAVGGPMYPVSLQDLLLDRRVPGILRHLRRIYADPLTGKDDWGLIMSPDGGRIIGVYSKAPGQPVKVDGFAAEFASFRGATSYAQWQFSFVATAPAQSPLGRSDKLRN